MADAAILQLIIQAKDEASHILKKGSAETGGLGEKLLALGPALADVAARIYARQHGLGIEAQNHAGQLATEALIRQGEMLKRLAETGERAKTNRPGIGSEREPITLAGRRSSRLRPRPPTPSKTRCASGWPRPSRSRPSPPERTSGRYFHTPEPRSMRRQTPHAIQRALADDVTGIVRRGLDALMPHENL